MTAPLELTAVRIAEDDLVRRARSDRSAFGLLFDRYYPVVLRHCVRRVCVRAAAEDLASEVFLQVARNMPTFVGTTDEDFRRWVFRIATNAINAELRQSHRRQELLAEALRAKARDVSDEKPFEGLDWPSVWRAVLEFDERTQAIVTLRFFEGLSHEEIGAIVDERPGNVRVILSRALTKLREQFV